MGMTTDQALQEAQAALTIMAERNARLSAFAQRLLNPEDLGYAASAEIRDAAREAAIKQAAEADADHQDFQLRDLRPMAGLAMLDAQGMDAARRLLGHTTERMTAAYTTKRRGFVSGSAEIKARPSTDDDGHCNA